MSTTTTFRMPTDVASSPPTAPKVAVKQKASTFSPNLKYKIVSDETVPFTKARAFEFLELKQFEGEREVRERHVQFLLDEWVGDRFLWQNVVLASAIGPTQEEYRINGQHTCWMRVNVPERYEPLDCKVRVMVYSVADDEQLRTLYSVFDRGAPRTAGHIGKVLLIGSDAGADLRPSLFGLFLSGFKIFWGPAKWKRELMSINDWCGMIESNYAAVFNTVGRFVSQHTEDARFVKRAAVVGAMFATFNKNVMAADEFWSTVLSGIGLAAKTDARWQLRNYLDTHGHSVLGGGHKVSQEEVYCVALNLWNHWRKNEPVSTVKTLSARPEVKK